MLVASDELVNACLRGWSERDDGLLELHLTSDERWLLTRELVAGLA